MGSGYCVCFPLRYRLVQGAAGMMFCSSLPSSISSLVLLLWSGVSVFSSVCLGWLSQGTTSQDNTGTDTLNANKVYKRRKTTVPPGPQKGGRGGMEVSPNFLHETRIKQRNLVQEKEVEVGWRHLQISSMKQLSREAFAVCQHSASKGE